MPMDTKLKQQTRPKRLDKCGGQCLQRTHLSKNNSESKAKKKTYTHISKCTFACALNTNAIRLSRKANATIAKCIYT